MKARKSRKIKPKEFEELYYSKNLPNKQIAEYFGVTESGLSSFRIRHSYSPRIRTSRDKVHPDRWTCQQCGDSFPNKTGHPRKFCNHKCYSASMKGTNPKGGFEPGAKHWNFTGIRLNRSHGHLVFTYAEKKSIAEACAYSCNVCHTRFEKLPIYKLQKSVRFDHTVAIALGGEHSTVNGQMLCIPCEKTKNSSDYRKIIKNNHK